MHLARLHQKHSSLAAANSLTQSAETPAGDVSVASQPPPPAAAAATTRPNNAPVTGINTFRQAAVYRIFALGSAASRRNVSCDCCQICTLVLHCYLL